MPLKTPKISFSLAFLLVLAIFALSLSSDSRAQQTKATRSSGANPANASQVQHGKYLVEGVAMCGMCHTPRNSAGNPDYSRWLDGAAVWLISAQPVPNWPLKAPRLAGNPPASDEELVTLLTTGIWRDGSRLRAPMPQFRMSKEDAESVVAYLRSLTPSPGD
jgi:mono/diheme cytochrome c family protein